MSFLGQPDLKCSFVITKTYRNILEFPIFLARKLFIPKYLFLLVKTDFFFWSDYMFQFCVQKIGQCTFNSELHSNKFGGGDKVIETEDLLEAAKGECGREIVSI